MSERSYHTRTPHTGSTLRVRLALLTRTRVRVRACVRAGTMPARSTRSPRPVRRTANDGNLASTDKVPATASAKRATQASPPQALGWHLFSLVAALVLFGESVAARVPSPVVAGLLRWLVNSTRAMFYLFWPSELALDDSDPDPNFFLRSGLPMFFIMIGIEFGISSAVSRKLYRLDDLLSCISLGAVQYVAHLLFALVGLPLGSAVQQTLYVHVWEHYRLFDIPSKDHVLLVYFSLLLGKDLAYYLAHRAMHEFHVLWIGHSVHHSGEDYNLGAGLRQGVGQALTWPFTMPLALLGFHPRAFAAHAQLNVLYMYWIHTDLVGRLPAPLEAFFNSPMAHRMHHRPPGNCNYAGVLIVWDRLFGTYQAEEVRKDHYGLADQPQTFDPFSLNCSHFRRLRSAGFSWWRILFSRRVPAKWTCSPSLLFEPIAAVRADRRGDGPVRRKWHGDPAGPPLTADLLVSILLIWLGGTIGSTQLLLTAKRMDLGRACLAGLLAICTHCAACRACDRRPAVWHAVGIGVPLMLTTAALVVPS